jgi:hypothetical protein
MKKIILTFFFLLIITNIARGEEYYSNDAIADAIYWTEGGLKTNFPFGIKSVYCSGYDDCRKVCINTIQKNRVRYSEYGHRQYKEFLAFLGSRYCPISENGCENWLPNLKFYLKKGK